VTDISFSNNVSELVQHFLTILLLDQGARQDTHTQVFK